MSLNALLMCRSQSSLRLLEMALDELGIEAEICTSPAEAMERLGREHFSAIVLDFDLPGTITLARLARVAPAHLRPVIFAMIGATTEIADTFEAGANFVLYKPLVLEQVERSLRAGRGFMKADRRRSPRQRLETVAYLRVGKVIVPAVVLDVNEGGVSLQMIEPLPALPQIPLRFTLPGSSNVVACRVDLIWADDSGRAGMLFTYLAPASRKNLKTWLAKRGAMRKSIARSMSQSDKLRRTPSLSH